VTDVPGSYSPQKHEPRQTRFPLGSDTRELPESIVEPQLEELFLAEIEHELAVPVVAPAVPSVIPASPTGEAIYWNEMRAERQRETAKSILQEADETAGETRSRDYGHPFENHRRIAAMWNIQLEKILKRPILPREVALMMVALKLAREINTPKRDNIVDAAGYLKCIDMIDRHLEQAKNGV
jgi:hypothetical protein